ncbi:hypothetical protein [Brachyspira hampsonii]|uniref:hypothetical protein n=1 Tax=Brachyspira hampsonii TaxID=1287055 RepID=UPI000D39A15A|nr:hypothetical protein [Brachyspira hampsonii]PTY41301.1 hypothetical protein DQ06_12590 [Brachyspira hampsonii bv. II]
MKKFLIIFFIFLCSIHTVFSKGLPLSTEVTGEDYSWIKGRQMISFNLNPGITVFAPMILDTIFKHGRHTVGMFGADLGNTGEYLQYVGLDAFGWYIPSIEYSLFVHNQISVSAGIGLYGSEYSFNISKDNAIKLLQDIKGLDFDLSSIVVSDTKFNASFIIMPVTFGVKFYGKKRQFYNHFRLAIDAFFYDIQTENGITGVRTRQSVADAAVYISYEIGWNIELFPTREWRVKPTIDIGLLEIGYYVRPWGENMANALAGNLLYFFAGGISGDLNVSNMADSSKMLLNFRIALFPRIGFSIRF